MEERARDPSTDFDPESKAPHPSSLDPTNPETVNFDGKLHSAMQRHKYQSYCLNCNDAKQTRRRRPNAPVQTIQIIPSGTGANATLDAASNLSPIASRRLCPSFQNAFDDTTNRRVDVAGPVFLTQARRRLPSVPP
jgi:hypothetical protein